MSFPCTSGLRHKWYMAKYKILRNGLMTSVLMPKYLFNVNHKISPYGTLNGVTRIVNR